MRKGEITSRRRTLRIRPGEGAAIMPPAPSAWIACAASYPGDAPVRAPPPASVAIGHQGVSTGMVEACGRPAPNDRPIRGNAASARSPTTSRTCAGRILGVAQAPVSGGGFRRTPRSVSAMHRARNRRSRAGRRHPCSQRSGAGDVAAEAVRRSRSNHKPDGRSPNWRSRFRLRRGNGAYGRNRRTNRRFRPHRFRNSMKRRSGRLVRGRSGPIDRGDEVSAAVHDRNFRIRSNFDRGVVDADSASARRAHARCGDQRPSRSPTRKGDLVAITGSAAA